MQNKDKIIIGVDPGTLIMGYGVILCRGQKLQLLETDVLKISSTKDHYERLELIYQKIKSLIEDFKPHEFAIEAPFFGKNVQSMLKLGRAQGVAIAAAMSFGIPITEYAPRKIKQAIAGKGSASKEQVSKMLQQIFPKYEIPTTLDATDALAVAVCHFYQTNSFINTSSKSKNWEDFLKKNANRIIK
ncbi:MAG: crossover junction endodeoxyribonuclease RuvC [Bacteroidia bacterium]|nr:MAG: crossover junction endodeoxyribonuclease RuvC [Bacteroidia bacterium]